MASRARCRAPAEKLGGRGAEAMLWAQLGISLAATVLLRQAALFVIPAIVGWLVWHRMWHSAAIEPSARRVQRLTTGLALTLTIMAVTIAPWTIRNRRVFNEFVLLNTNAGFAFFWANHPVHGRDFIPLLPGEGAYVRLIPDELRGLNEAQMERALLRQGLGFVAAGPWRYALLSASRVREYLKFWPSSDSSLPSNVVRVLSFGVCLPLMVLGVLLAMTHKQSGRLVGSAPRAAHWLPLVTAGAYALIHVLSWALVRYRLPVDALLMPFVALALVHLWGHLPRRQVVPDPIADRQLV